MEDQNERAGRASQHIQRAGARLQDVIVQVMAGFLLSLVFVGMVWLVYLGRLDPGALLFFSGIIVGFLAHVIVEQV